MSGPADKTTPPSRDRRERAITLIDAAYAEGQISGDEHDERVRGVMAAETASQLDRWTGDLQRAEAQPRPVGVGSRLRRSVQRTWVREWNDIRTEFAGYSRRTKTAFAGVLVALAGSLATLTVYELVNDDTAAVADQTLTTGIAEFRDAYVEQFGDTLVGQVQLDPEGARVEVPVGGDRPRYETWYFKDGSFSQLRGAHGDRDVQIDLAELDLAAAERNVDEARTGLGVPDVSAVTVLLSQPIGAESPQITFILRNEFDESARLTTDLAGREVSRETFAPGLDGES